MRRRSLIADDVRTSRLIASHLVSELGFEIVEAVDGDEAWEVISHRQLDLIVTDIEMPGRSGLQLLLQIRQHPDVLIRSLPVVVVSSLQDSTLERTVLDFGGTILVRKPIDKCGFQSLIREAVGGTLHASRKVETSQAPGAISPTLRRLVDNARRNVNDD